MTDWKGNEIKEGQTIVYIQVARKTYASGVFFKGVYREFQPASEERCWIPKSEYVVQRIGDRLGYVVSNIAEGYTVSMNAFFDNESWFDSAAPGEGHILAIKGISDYDDISVQTNELIKKALNK
jgi:hypothetical protein